MTFHVDSEVGRLHQVLLHRPELALKRLTPSNKDDFLFDDVLWVQRAVEEHEEWQRLLVDQGVTVHMLSDLLHETVEIPQARKHILDGIADERYFGPMAVDAIRNALDSMESSVLQRYLTGGITKRELVEMGTDPKSLAFHTLRPDDFVLPPLPNHLFTRDTSCWIYDGVSINAMRKKARRRETVNMEAIYRYHPAFAPGYDRPDEGGYHVWMPGIPAAPATIEGGDVLVIGRDAVLVGISERTQPQAVEMLARSLFGKGSATRIVALDMPKARAFMHLDTVMTNVDVGVFTKFAGLGMLPSYTVEPGDNEKELKITDHPPRTCTEPSRGRSAWTTSRSSARRRTCTPPSGSSGTTAATCWPCGPAWSWPTSATPPPTTTCAATGSRSSRSGAASSAGAGAARAA